MAIIVSCPQEVKLFMLGALFCGCLFCRRGQREEGRGSGLINNYALLSSLPCSPSSYCLFLSLALFPFPATNLSPPLFLRRSHRSDIKANLRRRSQAHRASLARLLARAKPGRVKIKSELICHERAPRLPFYPPRTLRRISAPPCHAGLTRRWLYLLPRRLSLSTPLEEFSLPASVVSLIMSPNCARWLFLTAFVFRALPYVFILINYVMHFSDFLLRSISTVLSLPFFYFIFFCTDLFSRICIYIVIIIY